MNGEAIKAYPLQWPAAWPRAKARGPAAFGKKRVNGYGSDPLTIAQGVTRVLDELRRMGIPADDVVISSNAPSRLDGLPKGDAANPGDPGAAVYWRERGKGVRVMAIDFYDRLADNLAAIAATLEAMRAIQRHGGAAVLERAFAGFAALPAPAAPRSWREVLGFRPDIPVDASMVEAAYRRLAGERHPDRGGSDAAMAELNGAREAARLEALP